MKIIKAKDYKVQENYIEEIKPVKKIINEIKKGRDKTVLRYAKKFDNFKGKNFELTKKQISAAYKKVDPKLIQTFKTIIKRLEQFSKKQFAQLKSFEFESNGVVLGQKIVPIEKIGCYVPGGNYSLPSTALMAVIPAKIAGCKQILVFSPKIKPETIVAADLAGATKIFNLGGVQAIAAMAFGTKQVPKVDKIVGPGNKFVTFAKKEVFGICGVDFLAGPSEVLVIADETANPKTVALDLIAQAEHDVSARPLLVTKSRIIAKKVERELKIALKEQPNKIAKQAIKRNGYGLIATSNAKIIEVVDKIAPEHLELQVKNPREFSKISNFGSLFIGEFSAEVFGDYCSGTNHVLPTNSTARFTSGLSVNDFVNIRTYQKIKKRGVKKMVSLASAMAEAEMLFGHKNSAKVRLFRKS